MSAEDNAIRKRIHEKQSGIIDYVQRNLNDISIEGFPWADFIHNGHRRKTKRKLLNEYLNSYGMWIGEDFKLFILYDKVKENNLYDKIAQLTKLISSVFLNDVARYYLVDDHNRVGFIDYTGKAVPVLHWFNQNDRFEYKAFTDGIQGLFLYLNTLYDDGKISIIEYE